MKNNLPKDKVHDVVMEMMRNYESIEFGSKPKLSVSKFLKRYNELFNLLSQSALPPESTDTKIDTSPSM